MAFFRGPSVVTDGLILYLDAANPDSYPGSGTNCFDVSNNGHTATLNNGVGFTSSNYGSFVFDGVDDFLNTNTFDYFNNWTDPVTISIWCRVPTDATWSNGFFGNIISRGGFTGVNGLIRSSTNNRIGVYFRSTDGIISLGYTGVERDKWFNLACTWDGSSTMILYFNGQSVSSTTSGVLGGTIDTGSWLLGSAIAFSGSTGNRYQGDASNIMFYNRSISPSEILQNYNATKTRFGLQ